MKQDYILAKKNVFNKYVDVFTHSVYGYVNDQFETHVDCVIRVRGLITTKKFITLEEAFHIVEELNPTYLPEKTKTLVR